MGIWESASPAGCISKKTVLYWRLALVGVFALAFLAYVPSLWGKLVWEDPQLISGEATGGLTLAGVFRERFLISYYRPFTSASFWLDRQFAGSNPFHYHLTSILLHASTTVLVSWLTLLITRKRIAAVAAGVCFAIRPAQIGAVAWIGGRTDVLATFFLVATLIGLIRYNQTKSGWWLAGSALSFLSAVLTKEQSILLAPAIPASVFVFGSRKWKEAVALCIPFGLCVIAYLALMHLPGKTLYQDIGDFSLRLPILTAANYASELLFPSGISQLTFTLYPLRDPLWIGFGLASLFSVAWLFFYLWRKNTRLAWVMLCGLLLYFPVSNLITVPSFPVAPYRMAETGTFVAILFGAAVSYVYVRKRQILLIPIAANLIAGGFTTWVGIQAWASDPILNASILDHDPHFMESNLSCMDALDHEGHYQDVVDIGDGMLAWLFASPRFLELISPENLNRIEPGVLDQMRTNFGSPSLSYLSNIFSREGKALIRLHQDKMAMVYIRDGLLFNPKSQMLNFLYGAETLSVDRPDALRHWVLSTEGDKKCAQCDASLGHEWLRDGKYSEAERLLSKAASEAPSMGTIWVDLSDAKAGLQDYQGALEALNSAAPVYRDKDAISERRLRIETRLDSKPRVRRS